MFVLVATHPLEDNYWIAGPDDDFAHLWQSIKAIRSSDYRSKSQVVLVGSSALREAIVSPKYLYEENPTVDWHLLTPGDLLSVETLQIVTSLPKDMEGLLFIEVSQRTLSTPVSVTRRVVSRPRFPEQSWTFQTALWKNGLPVGNGLGKVTFYASRMQWMHPLAIPINDWMFHQVDYIDPSIIDWRLLEQKYLMSQQSLVANIDVNLTLYRLIQEHAPAKMRIVWIASPRNREWESSLPKNPEHELLSTSLHQLESSVSQSIIVLDAGLESRHYVDHGHIVTIEGRTLSTTALLNAVHQLSEAVQ